MENERVLIAMDMKSFKQVLNEVFKSDSDPKIVPELQADRISKTQAAKYIGVTLPTLGKYIKLGKFKKYTVGNRVFLLKSEIDESLRRNL